MFSFEFFCVNRKMFANCRFQLNIYAKRADFISFSSHNMRSNNIELCAPHLWQHFSSCITLYVLYEYQPQSSFAQHPINIYNSKWNFVVILVIIFVVVVLVLVVIIKSIQSKCKIVNQHESLPTQHTHSYTNQFLNGKNVVTLSRCVFHNCFIFIFCSFARY